MNPVRRSILLAALALVVFTPFVRGQEPARKTGPWDVPALLDGTPKAEWGEATGLVRPVHYEGVPHGGKPTRVFAYYGRPEGEGPFPAMLLVHGGGGKAFREWAELWAKRGYVALAMDLAGHGPDGKRLPDGGPDQDDVSKFRPFTAADVREMWSYQAVADVLRGHALLASRPEVDAARIGVTGISWGGYLTCIVAGIDPKLKVAVPVYGCGFLDEDSAWKAGRFDRMSAEQRSLWVENFDPSRYLAGVRCPILFVNGTNDFAYPMGSYQKSYRLVKDAPRGLCITVKMPHGHPQGWAPKEIGLFVDSLLKKGEPLARLGETRVEGTTISAGILPGTSVSSAWVHYTTDSGPWQKREWATQDAKVDGGRIHATLPADKRPLVAFLTATDARGAVVSTEHVELPR
ncbi:MAG: acetylxylan esterase [Isosphaeraceae bacterium]